MLSKRTTYGLKALGYLAARFGEGPVLIVEIAQKKQIPLKFLESILLELKRHGILESKMGKGGGYFLKDAPEKVSLSRVIRLMDGPIALLPCVSLNFYRRCDDCREEVCGLNKVMVETRDATLSVLNTKTLLDLRDL